LRLRAFRLALRAARRFFLAAVSLASRSARFDFGGLQKEKLKTPAGADEDALGIGAQQLQQTRRCRKHTGRRDQTKAVGQVQTFLRSVRVTARWVTGTSKLLSLTQLNGHIAVAATSPPSNARKKQQRRDETGAAGNNFVVLATSRMLHDSSNVKRVLLVKRRGEKSKNKKNKTR
jgi:hypothetical protein